MLKFFLPLLFIYLLPHANACSIGINEKNITNILVAMSANEFNIDLAKASKIKKENFSFELIGEDPDTLCPLVIEQEVKVTIKYKKNLMTTCELSVVAKQILDESIGYPTYDFLMPTSSCTYTPIVIRRNLKPIVRP